MPELPEVETIVQELSRDLIGQKIISEKVLCSQICKYNNPVDLKTIKGRRIKDVRRRGKMILIELDSNQTVLFHLGMTGQLFFSFPHQLADRHTHFILTFAENPHELRFRDVRKFGCLAIILTDETFSAKMLRNLGPEPLEIEFPVFATLLKRRRSRMKSLFLDQSFIAGIGNIYADEILFRARLHPMLPASLLNRTDLKRLWRAMREILQEAIKHKGSSIRNYVNTEARQGEFQSFHQVYGKESHPCLVCRAKIERIKVNGRSSYFCPKCQPL